MNPSIIDEVFERLKVMPQSLQQQVLEFTRTLADSTNVKGVSGSQLLRFAGTISLHDLKLMSEAINQDCEQVERGYYFAHNLAREPAYLEICNPY